MTVKLLTCPTCGSPLHYDSSRPQQTCRYCSGQFIVTPEKENNQYTIYNIENRNSITINQIDFEQLEEWNNAAFLREKLGQKKFDSVELFDLDKLLSELWTALADINVKDHETLEAQQKAFHLILKIRDMIFIKK